MDKIIGIIEHLKRPSSISIGLYHDITAQPPSVHLEIETYTRFLIQNHPTHVITGGYSIGNLQNRPENTFIVVKKDQKIELILNYAPKNQQIIVYGTPSKKSGEWLGHLIREVSGVFLFCSGNELGEIGLANYSHSKSLKNTVYLLDPNLVSNQAAPDNVHLIDGTQSPILMKEVADFYEYDNDDISQTFRERPHVILKIDNKIVAGARCNEYSSQIAIIGGVLTLINHRNKGYGTIVCYVLTTFLAERCERVALETDVNNFPAMQIYEKIGYNRVGTSRFLDDNTGIIDRIIGDRDY
ncbi:MAG: GNAT family N-acetyltransferase [Candidatus Kariarchaeaceae archaeon]|jgi:hypothetical protein